VGRGRGKLRSIQAQEQAQDSKEHATKYSNQNVRLIHRTKQPSRCLKSYEVSFNNIT
jgi:hypothetical protein